MLVKRIDFIDRLVGFGVAVQLKNYFAGLGIRLDDRKVALRVQRESLKVISIQGLFRLPLAFGDFRPAFLGNAPLEQYAHQAREIPRDSTRGELINDVAILVGEPERGGEVYVAAQDADSTSTLGGSEQRFQKLHAFHVVLFVLPVIAQIVTPNPFLAGVP